MVRTELMRAPGKKGAYTKKKRLRARSGALVRSLARSLVRSLANEYTVHTGGERTERARAFIMIRVFI